MVMGTEAFASWILFQRYFSYEQVESLIRFLFIEFLRKYSTSEYETKIYVVIKKK